MSHSYPYGLSSYFSILVAVTLSTIGMSYAQSDISIDGSSTVYPITRKVVDKFLATHKPAISISVDISGSGAGFKKFCRGEIAITNASRPILKNEIRDCKNARVQYIEIPVAYDALTVAVHPDNHWSKSMTVKELKKLWEPAAQGKVMKWNQINPAWPDEPIKLFGSNRDSGTYDYFTEAIIGKAQSGRKDFTESGNDNLLVDSVAQHQNGLGFFGFAYYIENRNKVAALGIDNGDDKGAIFPSAETVENGSYQPLSRPIFIYVNAKAAETKEVKKFIEFYLKNALLLVKEVKLFPLPPRAYNTMLEHFNKKRVGTVFNGSPAVGLTIDDLIRLEGRLEFEHH